MVHDKYVLGGANVRYFPNTELGIEHILQPDHIGRTLSITFDVHALTNTLENDRKRGLSLINEMYSPGMTAMAAPVQRSGEPAIGVITIAGPLICLTELRMLELGSDILTAAKELAVASSTSPVFTLRALARRSANQTEEAPA